MPQVSEELRSQIVDFFPVLKSKEEVDNWLENMPPESPTGIALMVGFNYALEAMARHFDDE